VTDAAPPVELARLLDDIQRATRAHGRADLERAVVLAKDRLQRPEMVVCVAGEFKQGKSSLINAMLGVAACPVDDDLATAAVTVVRHGPELEISVRRRTQGRLVTDAIPVERLAGFVTERGNPENRLGVELVEIRVSNPLLERGWAFIDTPGIGGLNPAQAAAALAFLPAANALLFVSDASAELTGGELDFLARARDACPIVLVALTKVDLHATWREVAAVDRDHLAGRGIGVEPFAVSAVIRATALGTGDSALNAESGVPRLLEALQTDVLERASAGAGGRAADDGRRVVRQLIQPLEGELRGLNDPAAGESERTELAAARARLQELRGPVARWGQRLTDGFSDIAAGADYRFRAAMRSIARSMDDTVDTTDPGVGWDRLAGRLQGDVAEAVGATFTEIIAAAAALREEIAALIRDDGAGPSRADGQRIDVAALWSSKPVTRSAVQTGVGLGFGALRGAQSGVLLLGMLGNLFNLALIGPVLLGGAVLFAGKSMADERKRQLGQRRQEARTAVRQYTDDVQFEVGTRMRELLRELQREIRDDVAARLEELQRTLTESAASLERGLKQDAATRADRAARVEAELRALREIDARLTELEQSTPPIAVTAR
jgi:hypothetical protein